MMSLPSDAAESDSPGIEPIKLIIPKDQAMRVTQELFLKGRQINALYISTREQLDIAETRKRAWVAFASELFNNVVAGSDVLNYVGSISLRVPQETDSIETLSEQFHTELNQRLGRLRMVRQMIENGSDVVSENVASDALMARVATIPAPQAAPPAAPAQGLESAPKPRPRSHAATPAILSKTKIVLVLCSRNGTARQALCRFASQMNLEFEIIDFNPEQPATIAEQLYHHRDAKFAIIYWGEPAGRELPGSAHPERYVGFALGFVLGRLGRGRVFIMGSTATPPLPGFTRVLSAQLDSSGGWQIQLARRMKSAGVDVDLNKLT